MFIRTQREIRETARKREAQELTCSVCTKEIWHPPAIKASGQIYHMECAMQLVYQILSAVSGYAPEITNEV